MSIWFVIVTFHPEKKTLAALRKSLDGWPTAVINNTSKNMGFGGGANAGMRRAFDQGADWVVILNQDIAMTREATKNLVSTLKRTPSGIAGPFAGTLDPKRWTTILKEDGSRIPSKLRVNKSGMTKNVDYISGACMAIHRSVIERVGYFYEPYFMYYEDADLSVRAGQCGYPLKYLPIRDIIHREDSVWKKGSSKHEYFLSRNHLLFVLRLAPWRVKLHELVRLPKTVIEYLEKRKCADTTPPGG